MDKIKQYDQEQVLRFYDTLEADKQAQLEQELEQLNFGLLDLLKEKINGKQEETGASVYEPLRALKLTEIDQKRADYLATGIDAIKNCQVGAVLLAGGQGTRLGFDKPKGMFCIGENKELYIFQ